MLRKTVFSVMFIALAMVLLAACGGATSSGQNQVATGEAPQQGDNKAAESVPGVTDTSIKIGILNDFSGGAAFQGKGGQDGIVAYVDYINAQGGVNGRKIEIVSFDNQYTPAGNVTGAKKLISQDQVFAIPFSIGTGPTVAIKDYVNEEKVPTFGAGEGTEIFDPPTKYVFAVGTPYKTQGAIATRYVAETLVPGKPVKIAYLGQDDAYGQDPLTGVEEAAQHYDNVEIVFRAFHKRDALDFNDQILQLKKTEPDYVFISANVQRVGLIAQELAKQNVDVKGIFSMSLAAVDKKIFEISGNAYLDRFYGVSSIYTWDQTDQPAVQKAIDILKQQGKEDVIAEKNIFFWYGWNNMHLFVKAVEMAGQNLTRDGLVAALESFKEVDTGGTTPPITYTPDQRISGDSAFIIKAEQENGDIVWKQVSDFLKAPQ